MTMNLVRALLLSTSLWLGIVVTEQACTPQEAKTVTTLVVDAALAACVAANADLSEPQLQEACNFASDLWPVVRQILFGVKQGAQKLAAKGLASPPALGDAGK
jgi:hypothetical protein